MQKRCQVEVEVKLEQDVTEKSGMVLMFSAVQVKRVN